LRTAHLLKKVHWSKASVSGRCHQDRMKDRDGFYTLVVKNVDAWSPIDPNTVLTKRGILSPDEIHDYFTKPYQGEVGDR